MNDPLDVLVLGVGSIGERHTRCFLEAGANVAICEINEGLRRQVADRYPLRADYGDLGEALAAGHDAAVVATPASHHIAAAQQLADAGVHLLIEKPLAVDEQGIEQLLQTVDEKGLVAAVAYVYRAHPALAAVRETLRGEKFGKPIELVAVAGQHFPTYRPAYADTYYRDRATGGGAVQDALTHIVNAAEWLIGPADRVVADIAHLALANVEVEDTVHAIARHGEVLASYTLNQHQAPNETTLSVVCQRGTVRIEFHNQLWKTMAEPEGAWEEHPIELPSRDALFIAQARHFIEAVVGRAEPACTIEQGWQTLRVNRCLLESAAKTAWQTVAPPPSGHRT